MQISNSQVALSTSFHGNIISFLSGIPFISLDRSNKKYEALDEELLPKEGKDEILQDPGATNNRKIIQTYYDTKIDVLRQRARLNV
jgi:exopolysaccharide biosynthesis predicted pyruvyltransferase EpsI